MASGRHTRIQITYRHPNGLFFYKPLPTDENDISGAVQPFEHAPANSNQEAHPQDAPTTPRNGHRTVPGYIVPGNVQTPPMPRVQVETPVLRAPDQGNASPTQNKQCQIPSPDPSRPAIPYSQQLQKEAEKKRRKKKKKKKKRKRKEDGEGSRKRRKVVRRYTGIQVPHFPSLNNDSSKIHAEFAKTTEAKQARQNPALAFRKLTSIIVEHHKKEICKTYAGPFTFVSDALLSSLDSFEKTVNAKAESANVQFNRQPSKSSTVIRAQNGIQIINERRVEVQRRTEAMRNLVASLRDGSLKRRIETKLGDVPKPLAANGQTKEEAERASKELRAEHKTTSESIEAQTDKFSEMSLAAHESEEVKQLRTKIEAQRSAYKSLQARLLGNATCRPLGDILHHFDRLQARVQ